MFLTALFLTLAADPQPAIRVVEGKTVEVRGVPEAFKHKTLEQWAAALRVAVAGNGTTAALLGTHTLDGDALKFEPRFPFEPGVAYRVTFRDGDAERTHDFTLPKPKADPGTVAAVFPSADKLPENTLRFYVHFSKPMAKGDIYKHVTLTNDTDKRVVEMPFLELEEELWTTDQKRITLLIDPGRIKREVKPREDLGPALEAGKTFTLTIAKTWADGDGVPLKEAFRKTFTVTAADREAIDPAKWTISAPKAGGRDKLTVAFGKSLDAALAQRLVWLEDAAGKRLDGTVTLAKAEAVWEFAPKQPWAAGKYTLQVATHLEDPCGNRVGEPFEVDLLKPVGTATETKTVTRAVEVK
jgi:hypothetical protein